MPKTTEAKSAGQTAGKASKAEMEKTVYGKSSKNASALAEKTSDEAESDADAAKASAQRAVRTAAQAAKETAVGGAARAQSAAAERIATSAEALRAASDAYDPGSFERNAAERVARGIEEAAKTVRDTDISTVADELRRFARRSPIVFAGFAALVGFVAARTLKASDRARNDPTQHAHDPMSS